MMAFSSRQVVYGVFKLFIISFFQQTLCERHAISLSSSQRLWEDGNGSKIRSVSSNLTSNQQARLHPGVIAAVIFVAFAAILAAVLIIRKYCFPRSEATYRYSVLRQIEADGSGGTEEDDGKGQFTLGVDSDEEMLERIIN
ncbi:hypothetical protein UPYG_G00166600 [Umbra pygmaea]|uniref:Uncharacterized protein n=1 Tax=Umbra pygmaea TaxID=75934 RepID=A0ABD0WNI9_UMBPY